MSQGDLRLAHREPRRNPIPTCAAAASRWALPGKFIASRGSDYDELVRRMGDRGSTC
jgi:hypothetical protein